MEISPVFAHSFAAVLGLLIGSFLNVVIARLPHGESLVRPPSHCPKCNQPIAWVDNIPVFSWLWLRGKCRHCRASISPRYPVIELLTGILFLAAEVRYGLTPALVLRDLPFLAILVAVTFIDLEHRIIPDELSLGGLVWGLVTTLLFWFLAPQQAIDARMVSWLASMGGAALGFSLFFGLSWAYLRLTGRSGLGGGDVKLLAMIGAFLGPSGVFATILISSISGSVIGIAWAWWARRQGIALNPPNEEYEEESEEEVEKEKSDLPSASEADAVISVNDPSQGSESFTSKEVPEEGPAPLMAAAIPYGPFLVIGAIYFYLLGDVLWLQFTIPT